MVRAVLLFSLILAVAAWERPLHSENNFKAFVAAHARDYADEKTYALRLRVFQENMRRAELLGSAFGVAKFADRTPEEVRAHYGRYRRGKRQAIGTVHDPTQVVAAIPTSIDWRQHNVVTPVVDQGECGSCWAWSTVEEVESMWARSGHKLESLSVEQVLDCDTVNYGCDGGDPPDAYDYIKAAGGLSTAAVYPYTAGKGTVGRCKNLTKTVAVRGYAWATDPCWSGSCKHQNETAMEAVVATVGPLSICVDAADDWFLYTGGIYNGACSSKEADINHCVQLVGFGVEDGVKYWTVRNSWGTDWGEEGYIRLPMHHNACGVASEASYVSVAPA